MATAEATVLVVGEDERLLAAAKDAGLEAQAAAGAEALALLREDVGDVVLLDAFPPPESAAFLASLSGARRHRLFVVAVADGFRTGDRFQAWSSSVDLVVHPDDLGRLGGLLDEARADAEAFYRVFDEVRRWSGFRPGQKVRG